MIVRWISQVAVCSYITFSHTIGAGEGNSFSFSVSYANFEIAQVKVLRDYIIEHRNGRITRKHSVLIFLVLFSDIKGTYFFSIFC